MSLLITCVVCFGIELRRYSPNALSVRTAVVVEMLIGVGLALFLVHQKLANNDKSFAGVAKAILYRGLGAEQRLREFLSCLLHTGRA